MSHYSLIFSTLLSYWLTDRKSVNKTCGKVKRHIAKVHQKYRIANKGASTDVFMKYGSLQQQKSGAKFLQAAVVNGHAINHYSLVTICPWATLLT
jgi:hypothetical protein